MMNDDGNSQTAIKLTDKSNKLFNLNVGHWSLISMFNFFSPAGA